jgi:hypothetical protein
MDSDSIAALTRFSLHIGFSKCHRLECHDNQPSMRERALKRCVRLAVCRKARGDHPQAMGDNANRRPKRFTFVPRQTATANAKHSSELRLGGVRSRGANQFPLRRWKNSFGHRCYNSTDVQ